MEKESFQKGLRPWQHVAVSLLACAIIISRRPDMIFRPQFWAEDGVVWFAQAYNDGWWHSLFRTQVGYFQTLPRLAAALSLLVPMAAAPLVCTLIALAVQALVVNLLLSERSRGWGPPHTRALFAFIYLAIPNCPEVCGIITNAQWALCLAALIVVLMAPAATKAVRGFDLSVILLCGLTGPFCFFLLPIKIYTAWKRRERESWTPVTILFICCLVQAYGLLIKSPSERSTADLGPTVPLFIRILAGDIYLGAILGPSGIATMPGTRIFLFLLFIAIVLTTLIVVVLRKAPLEMKMLAAFAGMVAGGALISPTSYDPLGIPKWQLIAEASAVRYWLYASLLLLWCAVLGLERGSRAVKSISVVVLVLMCFGIGIRWRRLAFEDTHFAEAARSFEGAPAGTVRVFSQNPDGWTFQLIKHAR